MIEIMFYSSAAVAVLATIMMITRYNAVHALLYLIVSLLAVAIAFFSLGAPFAAALEVIIYAGAIMVLFVFVIMMLNLGREAAKNEKGMLTFRVWIVPVVMILALAGEFAYILVSRYAIFVSSALIPPKQVGISLFGTYLVGVELAGLLLLAGIIGAYHVGRTDRKVFHRFLKGDDQ